MRPSARTSTTCSRRSTRSSAPALGPGDLTGAYAGVRPLISTGDSRKSVDISRKAELYETSSGLITITGGKLTTWRRMAKLAVDRLVERDGARPRAGRTRSRSAQPVDLATLPRVDGRAEPAYGALAGRYGLAAEQVLRSPRERASSRSRSSRAARSAGRGSVRGPPRAGAKRRRRTLRRTRLGLLAARDCAPRRRRPRRVARAIGA